MKLIVGLGNPGKEYEKTRHNIGFICLNIFAQKHNLEFNKTMFSGKYVQTSINNEKYILLLPQKYMNLSGEVVRDYLNYFKIDIQDLLIISDDLDMETGKLKLKYKGSSGGHNGLKNISQNIGTEEFKRVKIGISNNKMYDTKDYVLGKFSEEEYKLIEESANKVVEIIENFSTTKFDNLMNKYNQ